MEWVNGVGVLEIYGFGGGEIFCCGVWFIGNDGGVFWKINSFVGFFS